MSEDSQREADQEPSNSLQSRNSASLRTTETEGHEEEPIRPLTPDEFRSVLERINAIGLTWSADIPPRIRVPNDDKPGILISEEYAKIQREYPSFPRELGLVVFYALTGSEMAAAFSGEQKTQLESKAAAVRELLVTSEYKAPTEFEKQKEAFKAIPPIFLAPYHGKFIASLDGTIVDCDTDLASLSHRFRARYGKVPVYITRVGKKAKMPTPFVR